MSFASFQFLGLFLPLALVGYYLLAGRPAAQTPWLVFVSLVFYAWSGLYYLPVLGASIAVNYWVTCAFSGDARRDGAWVAGGLVFNVVFLGYFKYTAFLLVSLGQALGFAPPVVSIAFPLGVSFFTIQQIMFLLDRYEGLVAPPPFMDYLRFVTFFPYITSGPITRWKEAQPKVTAVNYDFLARGLMIFSLGLAKKAVLANTLARWVDIGFEGDGGLTFSEAWSVTVAFPLQLYFDFSGYSDMAVGVGLMLGYDLPRNFSSPFRARSLIDFWKCWHMTLSRFITNYLYAPILRSLGAFSFGKAMLAIFLAMAIAGLWHGAAWTYVIFGLLHGVGLVINNCSRKLKWKVPPVLGAGLTLLLVTVAFVFFRAPSLHVAGRVLGSLVHIGGGRDFPHFDAVGPLDRALISSVGLVALGLAASRINSNELLERFEPSGRLLRWAVFAAVLGLIFLNTLNRKEFVYVDF